MQPIITMVSHDGGIIGKGYLTGLSHYRNIGNRYLTGLSHNGNVGNRYLTGLSHYGNTAEPR